MTPEENPLCLSDAELSTLVVTVTAAQRAVIEDAEDFDHATELRDVLNGIKKSIEVRRVNATKPLLAEQRRINGLADVLFDQIKPAIHRLDVMRTAYRDATRAPIVVAPADLNSVGSVPSMADLVGSGPADPVVMKVRKVQRVVVNDPALVPKEYWMIDQAKLSAAVLNGVRVPGAEIVAQEIPL